MANGNVDLLRQIAVLAQLMYDKSGVAELMKDSDRAIAKLREVAATYNIVSKAAKAYDQREIASETAKVTLESKKLAVADKKLAIAKKEAGLLTKDLAQENQRLAIANKKAALANKELAQEAKKATIEGKRLTNESKALRLEQQKAKGDQVAKGYRKQSQAARGLALNLDGVKDALIGIGVTVAAKGLFTITSNIEKASFRIRNFVNDAQFARLERRFNELNKQTDDLFSPSDFNESAAAVFSIDRSTRRFARSLEFAVKMGPVLNKSLKDIQLGVASAIIGGEISALEDLGVITALEIEEMQRRTKIPFSDLVVAEREAFVLNHLRLSTKQLGLADEASKGLGSTWNRFLSVLDRGSRILTQDFKPVAIAILGNITKFMRMLMESPIGLFTLRLGGLIAGIAALALGIGILTKAFAFLRGMLLLTNKATLLLWGKFLLISSLIIALILLIDDFWLALQNPKADTIFKSLFEKFPGLRKWLKELTELSGRLASDLIDFFSGEYEWENDSLLIALKGLRDFLNKELGEAFDRLDKVIEGFVNRWIDRFEKAGGIFKRLFQSASGSPIETFPETAGGSDFRLPPPGLSRTQISSLLDLLGGGLSQVGFDLGANVAGGSRVPPAPVGNRFFPSAPQTTNVTTISIGGGSYTIQAGLDRSEIIRIALEEQQRELEKQLIEADIGGR